jgi:hypothetical protein
MEQEKMILSHNQMKDGAKQGDFLGQEKLILGHNETNYGTNRVPFWDRRSWYWVITRRFMEQDKQLLGQEKLILSHKEMKYGTEQGHFLGQEKLTNGHNKKNCGTERCDFWSGVQPQLAGAWVTSPKKLQFSTQVKRG